MNVVVDASAIIAVIVNEPSKSNIIEATQDANLIAPASIHWEIANAFSVMFKRERVSLDEALDAIDIYKQIPIRFIEVELEESLRIAHQLNIYSYDAYLLRCAQKHKAPLISLDKTLLKLAKELKLQVIKVWAMVVYTYSEARQKLASLLDQVLQEGEVRIKRRDGQVFVVKPETERGSPFDVRGVDLDVSATEIVQFIQEGRRYKE